MSRVIAAVREAPLQVMLALVRAYRLILKPWLGNACRFEPTCSQYALTALERHGALIGSSLAAARLMRCHPWCEGGCDEVPDQAPALFTRLGLAAVQPSAVFTSVDSGAPSDDVAPSSGAPRAPAIRTSSLPVQEPAP